MLRTERRFANLMANGRSKSKLAVLQAVMMDLDHEELGIYTKMHLDIFGYRLCIFKGDCIKDLAQLRNDIIFHK